MLIRTWLPGLDSLIFLVQSSAHGWSSTEKHPRPGEEKRKRIGLSGQSWVLNLKKAELSHFVGESPSAMRHAAYSVRRVSLQGFFMKGYKSTWRNIKTTASTMNGGAQAIRHSVPKWCWSLFSFPHSTRFVRKTTMKSPKRRKERTSLPDEGSR